MFSVLTPDCGCILKYRSNNGFVRTFLCLLVADLEVALEEAKCLVGFVGDGVDKGAPFHVVLDVNNKIFCDGTESASWLGSVECNCWIRAGAFNDGEAISTLLLLTNCVPIRACTSRYSTVENVQCRRCGTDKLDTSSRPQNQSGLRQMRYLRQT